MSRILFILSSLPFFCLAASTCNDCAQLYGTVYAHAVSISNHLATAATNARYVSYRLDTINQEMDSIINYATQNDGHYDSSISGLASGVKNTVTAAQADLSTARANIASAYDEVKLQLNSLYDFNCTCGSAMITNDVTVVVTNACECPPYLLRIAMDLERIENGTVDFIQSITWSLWDVIEPNIQEIKRRLTVPDDDYKSDLNSLFTQLQTAISHSSDLLLDNTAANINSSTFAKSIDYMSNSDLALAYLYTTEYQDMLINRRSSRRLDDILSVISNININVTNNSNNSSQWSVDLAFISNYLYNIQRSYYELFNTRATVNLTGQNPFNPASSYRPVTNFWYWLQADLSSVDNQSASALMANRGQAYASYKQRFTNWWDRIEFALYGLAGGFDVGLVESSEFNSSIMSNNVNQYISSTNFLREITSVFNDVTNSVDTLSSAFSDFANCFHFNSSDDFAYTLQICPAITDFFGSFQFGGIQFDFASISDVCDIIRSSCRFIWTCLFSILGFSLFVRFFAELGKSIAHIFVLLKTLL